MKKQKLPGFTLVEILVVVALIAILATITIVALNPAKNFRDTRNTQRSAHVSTILNAVSQYLSQQANSLTTLVATDPEGTTIPTCPTSIHIGTTGALFDLTPALVTVGDYVVELPVDPQGGTQADTGYTMCVTGTRVTIGSANAEGVTIAVKR